MNYYIEVLKKYAVFEGRAQRKEYWMFFLINFLLGIVIQILVGLAVSFGGSSSESIISILGSLWGLYSLAILIPSIAVSIRRLHDTNHSGWWLLINLIPFAGLIVFIIFMATDSQPGENRYGPNPKGIKSNLAGGTPTPPTA